MNNAKPRAAKLRAAKLRSLAREIALAFAGGAVVIHWLPALHAPWGWMALAGLALLPPGIATNWASLRVRASCVIAGFALLGAAWGAWNALDAMARRIPEGCAAPTLIGRVVDLPKRLESAAGVVRRFAFQAESSACAAGVIALSWHNGPEIRGGERWRLNVRLRAPRGGANAYGFDAAKWHAREKLAATGYVVGGARHGDAPGLRARLDRAREAARRRLEELGLVNDGVLSALTLGNSAAIPRDELDRYRRTGTMHLLVISGLHVGVVTAFGFLLGRSLAWALGIPAKAVGAVCAVLVAIGYVFLAGAGLSLLRAFVMSVAAMLALLAGRRAMPSAVFAYALAGVLLLDPMAPLAAGFWLSFGAVAVLLGFFAPRARQRSRVWSAVLAQLAIAFVFTPATVALTGLAHPLGFALNLVAVPAVTLLVVPLALAGMCLAGTIFGPWVLRGADFCVSVVGQVLAFADQARPLYVPDPGAWLPWIVAVAAACSLPVSRCAVAALAAASWVGLCWSLWRPPPAVAPGEMRVTALDVGQGTAVLVRTARHALLYDTGPAFLSGANAGDGVVLPTLRSLGINALDVLVLSHGDLDHVGGATAVARAMTVARTLVGEPVPGIAATPCRAGDSWRFDDVLFEVLHPPPGHAYRGNDASCVLLVSAKSGTALLAGDIERLAEGTLNVPAVDWLLVPHHGSVTSSTTDFVAAARPRLAVIAAGWDNRFGHPHADVVARYRAHGAHIVSTAVAGELRWRSDRPGAVEAERCRQSPYWRRYADDRRRELSASVPPCA